MTKTQKLYLLNQYLKKLYENKSLNVAVQMWMAEELRHLISLQKEK